jgi:hypothetical protein
MLAVPGKRYALTLELMLKHARKQKSSSRSRSPYLRPERTIVQPVPTTIESQQPATSVNQAHLQQPAQEILPITLDQYFDHPGVATMDTAYQYGINRILRGFETTANDQLPFWLSDQSLGGSEVQQSGMDAFLLPMDYLPAFEIL